MSTRHLDHRRELVIAIMIAMVIGFVVYRLIEFLVLTGVRGTAKMRTLLFAAALLFCSQAHAESPPDMQSANFLMLGCETYYLRTAGQDMVVPEKYGIVGVRCSGIVEALMTVASVMEPGVRFCPPSSANTDQGLSVVVSYIRSIPQRTHENFVHLALEALQKAWPCRR